MLSERLPTELIGEAAARTKAIEYFHVEPALEFRVVATKLDKVKERTKAD
jgi:GTP-binding protein EngB required for normal cell division